ncbi:MAG: SDR family oxidoreductase [Chitinophagaceae bacterium]|nr:SDR family oxidoreductase [Chitinophagaceae bacterium]
MNTNLAGKNALVCGSSKGIGKAVAIALAELGANITLTARNEEALLKAISELDTSSGQQHDFILADFSKPDELKELIHHQLKDTTYQILVNNTGGPMAGNIVDATTQQFESAFSNHLICNHVLATALLPGMKKSNYGRIINIISTSVKIPLRGLGVSNTIRGAVANWSKTLATELAPFGITVNNVLPGATNTERLQSIVSGKSEKTGRSIEDVEEEMLDEIPMHRFADPSEIAAAAAFLASPAAGYITGINVPVDGGRTGAL